MKSEYVRARRENEEHAQFSRVNSSNDVIEADSKESALVKIARDPGNPTARGREDHCATHVPYRSWCPICVKAKGKEEAHRNREAERSCKATISLDYKAFGQEVGVDDKATAIILKDDKTKMMSAHICESKGRTDAWIVDKIVEDIERLGYVDIILKGDGEPALIDVMNAVKAKRDQPTQIQGPPAYDPQANGAAEKAVQEFMGQLRALKIGLEARLQCKVESQWEILEWATELEGELIGRCQVGRDGRTAYYRLYGRNSTKALIEIGEQVMAKPLRGKKTTKRLSLKDRWMFATWIGIDPKTNEHIVALADGGAAIRVRTVLRKRWRIAGMSRLSKP